MVTNPLMTTETEYGPLLVMMKGKEVNLNSVVNCINAARKMKGDKQFLDIHDVLRSSRLAELAIATEKRLGMRDMNDNSGLSIRIGSDGYSAGVTSNYFKSPLITSKRGRYGGTFVHPFLAIDVAMRYDADFAVAMYEILVDSPLFQIRENGGDLYKELVTTIQAYYGHQGRVPAKMQLLARVIAARCGVIINTEGGTWNDITVHQAQDRLSLMVAAISTIYTGLFTDFKTLLNHMAITPIPMRPDIPTVDMSEVVKVNLSVMMQPEDLFGTAA